MINYFSKIKFLLIIIQFTSTVLIHSQNINDKITDSSSTDIEVDEGTFYYQDSVNPVVSHKFNNISLLSISQNNKISLRNGTGDIFTTDLKYAKKLKIRTGSNTGAGIILGAMGGTVMGLLIGAIIDNNNNNPNPYQFRLNLFPDIGKLIGAGVGLLAGGVLGGVIGSQVGEYSSFNLQKINENERSKKMIRFLNEQ